MSAPPGRVSLEEGTAHVTAHQFSMECRSEARRRALRALGYRQVVLRSVHEDISQIPQMEMPNPEDPTDVWAPGWAVLIALHADMPRTDRAVTMTRLALYPHLRANVEDLWAVMRAEDPTPRHDKRNAAMLAHAAWAPLDKGPDE